LYQTGSDTADQSSLQIACVLISKLMNLIEPYGGTLVSLMATSDEHERLRRHALTLNRLQLSRRSICDLEMLATGAFSPLTSFMGKEDHSRVVEESRLSNGQLFPIPITLPLNDARSVSLDKEVALTDEFNNLLAVMRIEEIFEWDREREAEKVFGTTDLRHPLVAEMNSWGKRLVAGPMVVLDLPSHRDFRLLRMTPSAVRERLAELGVENVVAFQTRNPLHRAHEELTKRAAERAGGALLIHPAVGMTRPGDVDHFTRVRSYRVMYEKYFDRARTLLSLIPLAMRMAGPREAVWHAIIRRNYGANHFIVGRDHASPGKDSRGRPFYHPTAAQELIASYRNELGITPIFFNELVYLPEEKRYEESSRVSTSAKVATISGTEVRENYLQKGIRLPEWFTRPEVGEILAKAYPPQSRRGFCIWFTGLSGAGKSTTAEILSTRLLELGRQVTILDGDVVRTHLSRGLGFSRDDRDTNVRRIGFVASEVARHGGAVICAAVSPYRATRNECRAMFDEEQYIEVFVDAPLEVCESRDTKGMYALAREGKIENFTGISDPYEVPVDPEIRLDSAGCSAEENAERIISFLLQQGYVESDLPHAGQTA
jgi:sulfate adenylyltransferase